MNQLTSGLARVCKEHLLDEKWLLAPSLRVGHQWLTAVARFGQPAINVHVKTLTNLAIELAGPEMAARGVELIAPRQGALLIDAILNRLRHSGGGYIGQLPNSAKLAEAVHSAIDALRRADVTAKQLHSKHFEVAAKGQELAAILEAYLDDLRKRKLIDHAELFRMAIRRLREDRPALPSDLLILAAEDIRSTGLDRILFETLPGEQKRVLQVDSAARVAGPLSPRPLDKDMEGPATRGTQIQPAHVELFRAVGEANEVREVLRRCLAAGTPLDEVELLYTDGATYVPLVYEIFARYQPEGAGLDELPVTFLEGIPTRYFRPGRALKLWLGWLRGGHPQQLLSQMIQEGLLHIEGLDEAEVPFSRLAEVFRSVGIGMGRERYLPKLDEQIISLRQRIAQPGTERADEGEPVDLSALQDRLQSLELLRGFVENLLAVSPAEDAGPIQVLSAARQFLEKSARCAVRMDNYARIRLVEEIDAIEKWLNQEQGPLSSDVWEWLAGLPDETSVGGSGPRGGCLHVAPVANGGHSGRAHTFIIGLDDARFPGAGLQDPILLDGERDRLSAHLSTATGRLEEKLDHFGRLLARLRGTVTLSYSCHELAEDAETFPSSVYLGVFRRLAGDPEADHAALLRWLPPAASFAPDKAEKSLDETEWWLCQPIGPQTWPLVEARFPHLKRGVQAARQRASADYTSYDGWIPMLDPLFDPANPNGPVVSASRLETLGRCPLAYFFKYVLQVEPPRELAIDSERWLDAGQSGSLIHAFSERFIAELIERKQSPDYGRDERLLTEILDELVDVYLRLFPPPSEHVYRRQRRRLEKTARILLHEEEEYQRSGKNRPAFLEAAIGLESAGPGTLLDTLEPVRIPLPDGGYLRARGRIDRIDRVNGESYEFAIWDYKSGRSSKFGKKPPFNQGRVLQHIFYLKLAEGRFKALVNQFPESRIRTVGFFFPSEGEFGERLMYTPEKLSGGDQILQHLTTVAANGTFLATNDDDDCRYCDYCAICGDTKALAQASQRKLDNPGNVMLQSFLALREHQPEAGARNSSIPR